MTRSLLLAAAFVSLASCTSGSADRSHEGEERSPKGDRANAPALGRSGPSPTNGVEAPSVHAAKPEPDAPIPDASETATTAEPNPSAEPGPDATPVEGPSKAKPGANGGTKSKSKTKGSARAASNHAEGRALYMRRCKSCHGKTGEADTKMGAKHDMDSWKQPGWRRKWTLGKIEAIVRDGKPDTKMKSFAKKLSASEIKTVSAYARSLGK